AHPGRLERPAGTNPAPRGRRATPENPQTAPHDPRRPRRRATLTPAATTPAPITTSQDSRHNHATAHPHTAQTTQPAPRTRPKTPAGHEGYQETRMSDPNVKIGLTET